MNRILGVNLGRNRANRIGTVGVRLINSGGSVTTARSTANVVQTGSGFYFKVITIPQSWSGIVLWDDGGTVTRMYAAEVHDPNDERIEIGIGTILNRIAGTIKQANAGTFSYASIARIVNIAGTVNAIKGTVNVMHGSLNALSVGAGSAPAYIGSAVWSKKPTNFTTGDTFGWIFQRMLQRSDGGVVGIATPQIFSSAEKEKLFKWIDAMFQRLKSIEDLTNKLSSEFVRNIIKDLSTAQNEVKIIIKKFFAEDFKESKAIKQDVRLIIDSLQHTLGLKKKIADIEVKLSELNTLVSKAASPDQIVKIVNGADKSSELKTLINQAMNISADVKELSNKIIEMEVLHLEESALTDKAILALLPPETLKTLLEKEQK